MDEQEATKVGNDRNALRRRLLDTKACLRDDLRKGFGPGRFDFANKRMIGNNGILLQWQLRRYPDREVDYDNQQTRVGSVLVFASVEHYEWWRTRHKIIGVQP